MLLVRCILLLLIVCAVPSEALKCVECGCEISNLEDCYCDQFSDGEDDTYCIIYEIRGSDGTYVQMTRVDRNATYIYIEDPYYVLVQESIRYNRSSGNWYLYTTGVIFGCDWDECNSPDYAFSLPNSFRLSINEAWLNTNIYGTGSVSSCFQCDYQQCTNNTSPIDMTQCPSLPCDGNITSCLAYDLWNDLETGEQCYQSGCLPPQLVQPDGDIYGGKYRLDIEALVYLEQNRSAYDIWELDVYCAAPNCTRPTIFKEILDRLSANISDLSIFPPTRPVITPEPPVTSSTPAPKPLKCYNCECFGTLSCPCAEIEEITAGYTYCVLIRENFGQDTYIYSGHLDLDSSFFYIREFPYALVEESISYNEIRGRWITTTNFVIYGCNWDLCNKPELVSLLPNSYQMRLPESWLNTSVLGTGQPVRDCHECPEAAQCGTTEFLDAETCPIQPCNTTCLVLDTFNDPDYDYLCYQSLCLPPDTDFFEYDRHRVEIEGVVYASDQSKVDLWEIDIYCRADDCSRPGIFKELREQLSVETGTLSALFNETHDPNIPQLRCYDCYCYNDNACKCDKTTIQRADSTYCTIVRESFGQDLWVAFEHINRDSTRVYIREFPYLLVEESILYGERTGRWDTITNFVVYGCNWDYCNHPRFLPYMPNGFQMRLSETWLNNSVLGTGKNVRDCHECPDAPQCGSTTFLDPSRCPIKPCNTTCLVFDTFNDPAVDEQCYQSFCAPPDTEEYQIEKHRVELEGILYLNKPSGEVELWEADIYCRADDCSRPEIFTELRAELKVQLGDLSIFKDQTTPGPTQTATTSSSSSVTTSSTATPRTTSSTEDPQTTTPEGSTGVTVFTTMSRLSTLLLVLLVALFHA